MFQARGRWWAALAALLGLVSLVAYAIWKSTITMKNGMVSNDRRVYELSRPDVWGGFGALLIGGDGERNARGDLLVYRTGPFMPPITLPGMGLMVVSDEFRIALEGSGLRGLAFHPAIKHRIVEVHWEHWDRRGEIGELPHFDDPSDLLLKRPHSEEMSRLLGPIWDARTRRMVEAETVYDRQLFEAGYELRLVGVLPNDLWETDFFGAVNRDRVFISSRAKQWLEAQVPEWVRIRPVFVEPER